MRLRIRPILVSLALILNSLLSNANSIEVSGLVSGSWEVDTVNIIGNIELRQAETLIINPGVIVMFHQDYYFRVSGSLKVLGNQDKPISFTIADTTSFNNDTISDGGWKQIRIENISSNIDSIIFNYCHFEYGKAVDEDSIHGYGGALCIRNANQIRISNCSFENNYAFYSGGGIYLENSTIIVNNNLFKNNRCGQTTTYYGYGGGMCIDSSESLINHNYFTENSSTGIGGGLCVRFLDCPVFHNIFDNNYSALGGGFGILHIDNCNFVISNNLLINNTSLFFGAGISNNNCSPTYVNNTIANNHCDGGGGGLYCKDSVAPILYNNILYGNTQYGGQINQVYLWDRLSQPNFYYNNIQGGIESFAGTGGAEFLGQYQNNISEDPLFENESFSPSLQSPCINTASPDTNGLMIPSMDLGVKIRLVDNNIDMGAYEQQRLLSINSKPSFSDIKINRAWPNPSNSDIVIDFEIRKNEEITYYVTDINGAFLKEIDKIKYESGQHKIIWKLEDQPKKSGLYILILKTPITTKHLKLVVSRQ